MNLWHDVPAGDAEIVNVIIEIPRFSKNKYEIDKETGLIKLDRPMHTAQDYPFDYGFIPQTYWDDADPLDVVVLTTYPLLPGILVEARPVGIMAMTDDGEDDHKLIAVPAEDPRFAGVKDLNDINSHTLKEMEHFFSTYKALQNKEVVVKGFEGAQAARKAVERAKDLYRQKFAS
ncbi:inorganic diphosphatase [Candidatus Parcubacteria bacterium]|nr:MAG: inorganic diphosphatase [Candidatus Parcubacteria bacterium]GIW68795.1 MAG: inorganic pyrophosphatase [Candidatus Parcubacteria bacterium]